MFSHHFSIHLDPMLCIRSLLYLNRNLSCILTLSLSSSYLWVASFITSSLVTLPFPLSCRCSFLSIHISYNILFIIFCDLLFHYLGFGGSGILLIINSLFFPLFFQFLPIIILLSIHSCCLFNYLVFFVHHSFPGSCFLGG